MSVVRNIEAYKTNNKMGLKEKFSNPQFILDELARSIQEGDIASSTDLISVYISHCPKYKNQSDFAQAIGTTRQTLHRMFAHDNVNLNVFFKAIEQIYDDASSNATQGRDS